MLSDIINQYQQLQNYLNYLYQMSGQAQQAVQPYVQGGFGGLQSYLSQLGQMKYEQSLMPKQSMFGDIAGLGLGIGSMGTNLAGNKMMATAIKSIPIPGI